MSTIVKASTMAAIAATIGGGTVVASDTGDGASLFSQKCSGCHTVGKGKLVGPDLEPTHTWETDKLTGEVKRMEKMAGPLADTDVAQLVKFLKSQKATRLNADIDTSFAAPVQSSSPAKPDFDLAAEPGSAQTGRRLFTGEQGLANGGMACIACHQAESNGGTLAPDLSAIAEKMSPTALVAACEKTPYKVMKEAYASHPVTRQEAIDLTKYFDWLKTNKPTAQRFPVGLVGVAGAVLMMILIALGYRNRNTSVRDKLTRR